MSRIAVVHYLGATMQSRSVVASLLADLADGGHKLSLLDISHFSTITQDLPPGWVARALGQKVFSDRFDEVLRKLHVIRYQLQVPIDNSFSFPSERWSECIQAIDSELLTYFRVPSLSSESHKNSRMRRLIEKNALATYSATSSWLAEHRPDELIIPNGRTSRQKVARIAAEELGIAVRFYENGRARQNSYYLGATQPHDRLASQNEVASLTKSLNAEEIKCLADEWLCERMNPSSKTNHFSANWNPPKLSKKEEWAKPIAVFFPSSTDEFLAFGPMWNIDEWETQFQAFDLIMTVLEKKGCDLALRLHPSLGDKSREYFCQTAAGIKTLRQKHPSLVIYWHNSSVNSYDLVAQADYVFVERSTIGLEASLVGKPVWLNQAAQWDLIADVRQALEPCQITEEFLTPWKVDVSAAQRFVAYWMLQETALSYSWRDWATWDPDSASWHLRLATLFNKNPWSHRLQLLVNAFTSWRNNRFTPRDILKEVG